MSALPFSLRRTAVLTGIFFATITPLWAEDWPTYLKSNARVGAVSESLAFPLSPQWTATAAEAPEKSWPGPQDREIERKKLRSRMTFDDAFHVAIVGDRLYYGSSVDHQMRCVNLESGEVIWSFFSEGPIRLAPTVYDGKVYFGSDDGKVYCLEATDGSPVWKIRPGPSGDRLLGRQQMISRWPIRTGVAIHEDKEHGAVAYFGAGIFPHENVYLFAVNADNGEVIWKVDNLSQSDASRNDLSPQGYLLTTDELLVIPSGRSLPGVFDRKDGQLIHKKRHSWRRDAGGVIGGTQALLADGQIYAWGAHHILAMDQEDGKVGFGWFAGHQLTIANDAAYAANGTKVARLNREAYAEGSRERHKLENDLYSWNREISGLKGDEKAKLQAKIDDAKKKLADLTNTGMDWAVDSPCESRLIVAGDQLIAGGEGLVVAYDIADGEERWRAEVNGEARGLAAANGKLIVSTTSGEVICFGSGGQAPAPATKLTANPFPKDELTERYAEAAQKILDGTKVKRGFCLVVGAEDGRLAWELAQRGELEIYGIEPDAYKVKNARKKLAAAGYYGTRISIHHGNLGDIPYANYFANLVVSDTLVKTGHLPEGVDGEQVARKIKPVGGMAVVDSGNAGALESLDLGDQSIVRSENGLSILTRGPLPGAGSWSHQYGEAGNTATANDHRIKGGLGVLWFGDPGEGDMVNRHEGSVAPLAINGRLIAQGQSRIMAYDAYNGLFLWERDNPDSVRTGVFQNQNPGNLVASDDSLFFMEKEICVELDAATGEEIARHQLPESVRGSGDHHWGYVSYKDGILFGAASVRKEIEERSRRRGRATEDSTDGVFAIDVATGKHLWHYVGKTIEHRTIAIGDDAMYFIDSTITADQRQAILNQDKSKFANLTPEQQAAAEAELKKQDLRLAVALNSRSGEKLWEKAVDVTDCSDVGTGGGKLTLMFHNNVLVLCGANANGHYWKQFMSGEFETRRLVALSGNSGDKMWSRDGNYRHRPIIVEDEIIAEPWSYDLYTGKQITRKHPLTGADEPWSMMRSGHHCGMIAGTPNMLMFRSGFTGFYDLEQDIGTKHFAGHRTGCWINAIPANGLISIPESSAGCVCLFSIASTIVMEPVAERKDWAIFSSTGAQLPVKSIAINLGGPGDRRAEDGKAWIAAPRPAPERATSLDLDFSVSPAFENGGGFVALNSDDKNFEANTAAATGEAGPEWLYASAAEGLLMARIPLIEEGGKPAKYKIRVHMLSPQSGDGERHFNLRLQGKVVADQLVVSNQSRVPQVLEFTGIEVVDELKIEQFAKDKNVPANELPVLNGIEIVREE